MSDQVDLTAVQGDDAEFEFSLTFNGKPLDLTPFTVQVVVKASQNATDGSGTTYTTSNGIDVTDETQGDLTFTIPHTATATSGKQWYRLSVVDGTGKVSTACYGYLTLTAA